MDEWKPAYRQFKTIENTNLAQWYTSVARHTPAVGEMAQYSVKE